MPSTWEHDPAQMSAGGAFASIPQVLHLSLALGGHVSHQEGEARLCPENVLD